MSLALLPLLDLLVQSPNLRFAGGDGGALVREVAQARQAPVALLAEPGARYPAFTVAMAEPEDFRRLLNPRAGLATGTKTGLGLAPEAWPEGMYFLDHRPDYLRDTKTLPVKASFVGGKAALTTVEAPARLSEIVKGRWSKPFRVHWFYRDAAVWASAKDAPEADVARTLAEAVGASFREEKDAYVLGFDPRAYRARGVERLQASAKGEPEPLVQTGLRFTRESLRLLDDARLTALFSATPEEAARKPQKQVGLDSTALRRLAYDKMAASFGLVDGETTLPARKRMWAHHKQYVDWNLPPQVGLSQSGLYTAIFRGTDYDGKPFQVLI